ncbi:hypothetical protein [Kribbella sp. NBC_00359]|uniref:hypothetical protein n=1 Tax=Kribbella sp. NBC_00359 TaxID=2975966 RepID=UPI002E2311F3
MDTQLDLFGQVEAVEAKVAAEAAALKEAKAASAWHPSRTWRTRLVNLSSDGVLAEAVHRKTYARLCWYTTTEEGAAVEAFLNLPPEAQKDLSDPTEAYVLRLFEADEERIAAWKAIPGNWREGGK